MPAQKRHESKQDYATPDNLIAATLHRLMIRAFAFDFAANKKNTKAARFWSSRDNSLAKTALEWLEAIIEAPGSTAGWGWLNPPFKHIEPWAELCYQLKCQGGRVAFLVPASVGSDWFRDHVHEKALVLALNGRLAFMKGQPRNLYPKDCVLCLFAPDVAPGFEVWDWRKELECERAAA